MARRPAMLKRGARPTEPGGDSATISAGAPGSSRKELRSSALPEVTSHPGGATARKENAPGPVMSASLARDILKLANPWMLDRRTVFVPSGAIKIGRAHV